MQRLPKPTVQASKEKHGLPKNRTQPLWGPVVLVGVYQPVLPIQSDILEELRGPEVSLALGFLGKWYEIVIFDSGVICNPMKWSDFSFFCGINVWYTHPGRLTWNLQITHLERKMIFQTSMIMFHVNLQGCINLPIHIPSIQINVQLNYVSRMDPMGYGIVWVRQATM